MVQRTIGSGGAEIRHWNLQRSPILHSPHQHPEVTGQRELWSHMKIVVSSYGAKTYSTGMRYLIGRPANLRTLLPTFWRGGNRWSGTSTKRNSWMHWKIVMFLCQRANPCCIWLECIRLSTKSLREENMTSLLLWVKFLLNRWRKLFPHAEGKLSQAETLKLP